MLSLPIYTLCLSSAFALLAPAFPERKQRAQILAAITSACSTAASIPFVYDYLVHRGAMTNVRLAPWFAVQTNRFYQAYLMADMLMGYFYYSEHVNLLTGWIHHLFYIVILHLVVQFAWAHIFCLSLVMELPTFVLAIARLNPSLRCDSLIALTFFTTRMLFVSYLFPVGRSAAMSGSSGPAYLFTLAFPTHASWFADCIKDFLVCAHNQYEAFWGRRENSLCFDAVDDDEDVKTPLQSPPPTPRLSPVALGACEPDCDFDALPTVLPPLAFVPSRPSRGHAVLPPHAFRIHSTETPLRIQAVLAAAAAAAAQQDNARRSRLARISSAASALYEALPTIPPVPEAMRRAQAFSLRRAARGFAEPGAGVTSPGQTHLRRQMVAVR